MSVLRHVVGFACEMLTLRDPYAEAEYMANRVEDKVLGSYIKQNHDMAGRPVEGTHTVWRIQANTMAEASEYVKGTTIEGNRTRSVVHVGNNLYEIDVEEWSTSGLTGSESPSSDFSLGGCVLAFMLVIFGCPAVYYLMWWVEQHPDLVR